MRYSPYATPRSAKFCVMPISRPVVGSASIEMSGTARPPVGLGPTTFFCQPGSLKIWLNPPPAPYWNGAMLLVHAVPAAFRRHWLVPQPVSHERWPFWSMASEVPPTEVTHVSPVGQSGCLKPLLPSSSPRSPDEK